MSKVESELPLVEPSDRLYRVARKPDPWQPPDWRYQLEDKTFGQRFDDPKGKFRVLYAGSTRLACFLETLAHFRNPGVELVQQLEEITGANSDDVVLGQVPASWLENRLMGSLEPGTCRCAPIYESTWLSHLRRLLEPLLLRDGLIGPSSPDFDLHLLMSQNRSLTQQASRIAYEQGLDGLSYQSRHGVELTNWALFHPMKSAVHYLESESIAADDADFRQALRQLDLTFDPSE